MSEIPEALKAKAREVADAIILEGANVRSLVGMEAIARALLQVRNEAIAEADDRAAKIAEQWTPFPEPTSRAARYWLKHCARLAIAAAIRARP